MLDYNSYRRHKLITLIVLNNLRDIFFGNFIDGTVDGVTYQPLPLASQVITDVDGFIATRFALEDCYPNPAKGMTTIHFRINTTAEVGVNLMDIQGKKLQTLIDATFEPGEIALPSTI